MHLVSALAFVPNEYICYFQSTCIVELVKEDMKNSYLVNNEMPVGNDAPQDDAPQKAKNIVPSYAFYVNKLEYLKQISQTFVV